MKVNGSRVYCSKRHNKLQVVWEQRNHALEGPNPRLGNVFAEVATDYLVGPRGLKPTRAPAAPADPDRPQTLSAFVSDLLPFLPLLLAMLEALVSGEDGKKILDQKERATRLASALTPNHTRVRLMDGHGGFLILFLDQVQRQHSAKRLDELTIELVDLDPNVNDYHEAVFRHPNILCSCENIMPCTLTAPPENTLVYPNFCGISKSFEDVKIYLQACCKARRPVFISLSCARRAAAKGYLASLRKTVQELLGPNKMAYGVIAGSRKTFKTVACLPLDMAVARHLGQEDTAAAALALATPTKPKTRRPKVPLPDPATLPECRDSRDNSIVGVCQRKSWYHIYRAGKYEPAARMDRFAFAARYQYLN